MKYLNLKQFLECPSGTLFCKFFPDGKAEEKFAELCIKLENAQGNDFYFQAMDSWDTGDSEMDYIGFFDEAMKKPKKEVPMDLTATHRDGFYDEEQMYCVFSEEEHQRIIDLLQAALEK